MAWGLGGNGSSVCIDARDSLLYQIIDMDADDYGDPRMRLQYEIVMWFEYYAMDDEWWVDDLGNVWFEFETRGQAMLFTLEFL